MKRHILPVLLAALLVLPTAAQAQETEDTTEGPVLAQQLARYGMNANDPYALLAAARLLIDHPVTDVDARPETEGTGAAAEAAEAPYSALDLVAAAREAAGDDEGALALADALEPMARQRGARGAVGGPYRRYGTIASYSTDTWTVDFEAGERAYIRVTGDRSSDLDCYLYDENGNLGPSDTDYTDTCFIEWVPQWTGTFYLEIDNLGGRSNTYLVVTN